MTSFILSRILIEVDGATKVIIRGMIIGRRDNNSTSDIAAIFSYISRFVSFALLAAAKKNTTVETLKTLRNPPRAAILKSLDDFEPETSWGLTFFGSFFLFLSISMIPTAISRIPTTMSIPLKTSFGTRRSNSTLPTKMSNVPSINAVTAPPTRKAIPLDLGRVEEPRINIATDNRGGLIAAPSPSGIN